MLIRLSFRRLIGLLKKRKKVKASPPPGKPDDTDATQAKVAANGDAEKSAALNENAQAASVVEMAMESPMAAPVSAGSLAAIGA